MTACVLPHRGLPVMSSVEISPLTKESTNSWTSSAVFTVRSWLLSCEKLNFSHHALGSGAQGLPSPCEPALQRQAPLKSCSAVPGLLAAPAGAEPESADDAQPAVVAGATPF